jgi:hypothetical protein
MHSRLGLLFLAVTPVVFAEAPAALPLFFIPNLGQMAPGIRYAIQTPELCAGFTAKGVVFKAGERELHLNFNGANPQTTLSGQDLLTGRANFLLGNDEKDWKKDVPLFSKIQYANLYPGITAQYAIDGRRIKSEYSVAPGADPSQIILNYSDADSMVVNQEGALEIRAEGVTLTEQPPVAYQTDSAGQRVAVESHYRLRDSHTAAFELSDYDASLQLVIDPVISYSTYFGGSGTSSITGLAVDSSSNLYLTGWTDSLDFPIAGAEQAINRGGVDSFVAKLNANGSGLIYATYVGGASDDRATSIAIDSAGNAFVTGSTTSNNFPVASPAFRVATGNRDAFVFKLSSVGNSLLFSTYLGGSGVDQGTAIALDSAANVYVTGDTTSFDFPVQSAVQGGSGGGTDAFITKLTPAGLVLFSTYLGGSGAEHAGAITVGSNGSIYVAGGTFSTNFPVTGAFQASNGGSQDAFVTQLSTSGSPIFRSSYLGGSGGVPGTPEEATGIAVDSSGNIYVAGVTNSTNFPITTSSFQTTAGGGQDGFVTKINSGGTLAYSTYLGTFGFDWVSGIAIDSGGNVYLAGYTSASSFPQVTALQTVFGGFYDAFVTKVNPVGNGLTFSTFLGGTGADQANAIAVDVNGNIFVGGQTGSFDLRTLGPVQAHNIGGVTGWAARLGVTAPPAQVPSVVSLSPVSGTGNTVIYTAQYSHPAGATALTTVSLLVSTAASTDIACYVTYSKATGQFVLFNDFAATGSTVVPAGGIAQNSQCILNGSGSSVSLSGTTLTMTLSISFQAAFAGSKSVYLAATDAVTNTGLVLKGSWNVILPAPQPSTVGVSPSAAQGLGQTFTFSFADTLNAQNILSTEVQFSPSGSAVNSCDFIYNRQLGTISLLADNAMSQSGKALGSTQVLQNSQCQIGTASASIVGLQLLETVSITFKGGFNGLKTVYMSASEAGGLTTGFVPNGTYTVAAPGFPVANSVVPASGSGPSQRFTITVSDQGGASFINGVAFLMTTNNTNNACNIVYDRTAGTITLSFDTAANGAAKILLGSTQSISNSQCVLNGANTTVFTGPTSLVLTLDLAFNSSFFGPKFVYVYAGETSANTGNVLLGSWNVTGGTPTATSVSPSSGAGNSPNFTFTSTDSVSQANISGMSMLITSGSPNNITNACYLVYNRTNSTIGLFGDDGVTFNTKGIGSSMTLQNSQCAVGFTFANFSGTSVMFTVNTVFKPAFAGAKTVYLQANEPGTNSGFVSRGTFTAQ